MKKLSIFFSINFFGIFALNSIGLRDSSSSFKELISAINICDSKKVESILKSNNDPNSFINSKDDRGETPLIKASIKLNQSYCHENCKEVVRLLLEHGADINAKNAEGSKDALSTISSERCPDLVDLFLRYGADVNFRDNFNRSALVFASMVRNLDNVSLLLSAGADSVSSNTDFKMHPLVNAMCESKRLSGNSPITKIIENIIKLDKGAIKLKDIDDEQTKDIIIKRWINTGNIKSHKKVEDWVEERLKNDQDKKEWLKGIYLHNLIKLFEKYANRKYIKKLLEAYKEIASQEENLKINKILTYMSKPTEHFSDIDVKTTG